MGPKTAAAILFYDMHPHLKNDGILGPWTKESGARPVSPERMTCWRIAAL